MADIKRFTKRKLKNGITVLFEKRDLPLVSFSIANRFAASHEAAEIKGIAHCIEHLVFTGTKSRSHEDISREIEKKGGVLNAFTAQDVTSFWFKLPSEHLFAGMDILIDILNNPTFEKKKFEKEKKVILEEIKMYHDMPQYHVFEQLLENMYKPPFGIGIIGTKETVSKLERNFVLNFFKEKYNPKNFIVTIVGDADLDKVCDYLEKHFKPNESETQALKIEKQTGETSVERPGIDQAHFAFGIHSPMPGEKERYDLEVLDAYLASGMSSHLFLEIREKRGLAYSVRSSFNTEKTYSYYTIYVGTTKEAIPEVKKLILEGFKHAAENMTEKDLQEAKERLIGLKKISSEESVNVMNELLFEELSGQAEDYYTHVDKINKVKLSDVKIMAKIKEHSTAAIVPK